MIVARIAANTQCFVPAGPRPAREATDSGAPLGDSFRAKNKDNVNILKFLAENLEKEQVIAATLFCSATHIRMYWCEYSLKCVLVHCYCRVKKV